MTEAGTSPLPGHRWLTGLTLALLAAGLLLLPPLGFGLVTALVCLAAGWEWARLCGYGGKLAGLFLGLLAASIGFLALAFMAAPLAQHWLLTVAVLFWLLMALGLPFFPAGLAPAWNSSMVQALMGWLAVLACWAAVTGLRVADQGQWLLLWLLLSTVAFDSLAYLVGRRWGTVKLAARISPNKSWQGVAAGSLGVLAVAWMAFEIGLGSGPQVILMAVLLGWAALVGDLWQSAVKRLAGVKDSGRLFPGHGGLLDRLDSLLAAAPVMAWVWLGSLA